MGFTSRGTYESQENWNSFQNPELSYNGGVFDYEDDQYGRSVRIFNPFLTDPAARLDDVMVDTERPEGDEVVFYPSVKN